MNPAGLLRDTLAPLLASQGPVSTQPVLGIDEGLNNEKYVGALVQRLVSSQVVHHSVALWYQARKRASGEIFYAAGGAPARMAGLDLDFDTGTAVRGFKYPDEEVVTSMLAQFVPFDRLCLLTQIKKAKPRRAALDSGSGTLWQALARSGAVPGGVAR